MLGRMSDAPWGLGHEEEEQQHKQWEDGHNRVARWKGLMGKSTRRRLWRPALVDGARHEGIAGITVAPIGCMSAVDSGGKWPTKREKRKWAPVKIILQNRLSP